MSDVTNTTAASESVVSTPAQHTPGPWFIEDGGTTEITVVSADGYNVATAYGFCGVSAPKAPTGNARLIAAAPDMLDALQFVATDPCFQLLGSVTHDVVRAAIAKATGT